MRKARNMSHALVVLPLTLAVLLVSLCVPLTCSAAQMTSDCSNKAPESPSMPMHAGVPVQHTPEPMHQHGNPAECKHSNGNVQALNADQQVRTAEIIAIPAVVTPVIAAPSPLAYLVAERPAEPPGLVLTVSQLRI